MSNQVYRDKQSAVPYNGEQFTFNITLTGSHGGVGGIGVHLTRVCPFTVKMSIVSAQTGVNWGVSHTLTSAVGVIPAPYRPATETYQWVQILSPGGPPLVSKLTSFYVDLAGTISFRRVTSEGATIAIDPGAIVGLQDIVWIAQI